MAEAVTSGTGAHTASEQLGEFAAGLTYADLPAEIVEKTKLLLLHNLTVALAGHRLAGPGVALSVELGRTSHELAARLLVGGERLDLRSAAYANSLLMSARAQDDIHFGAFSHIGGVVIPVVLAVAEHMDLDGEETIASVVAGYEVAAALGVHAAYPTAARGLRPTLYPQLGAAAAAGRALGCHPEQVASAIGLAAAFGMGTMQTWMDGTPEWLHQAAAAGSNAILAGLLAARGVCGAPRALEGSAGVFASFAGGLEDAPDVARGLGREWRIRGVTFKPYPVCTINQVPVATLVELIADAGIAPHEVMAVELALNRKEAMYPGVDVKGPFPDFGAAMMSVQFCLAVALAKQSVRTDDLLAVDDPELLGLVERIDLTVDDDLPPRSCRLILTMTDGRRHDGARISTDDTFNWSRPEALMASRDLLPETQLDESRFQGFAATVLELEHRRARELIDQLTAA